MYRRTNKYLRPNPKINGAISYSVNPVSQHFKMEVQIMWLIQLLLAWALLYVIFRFIFGTGRRDSDSSQPTGSGSGTSESDSGYFRNAPDALRPDIEPDEFDPTDYL